MKKKFKIEDIGQYKILNLNLKFKPFEVMISGEKDIEFREIKPWMNNRLFNKDNSLKEIDYVKIMHAYNGENPYFYCEYLGITKVKDFQHKYSNGFEINFKEERWGIKLGEIVFKGNHK